MRRRTRLALLPALAAALVVAAGTPSRAGFSAVGQLSTQVTTGTVAPPTAVAVTDSCTLTTTTTEQRVVPGTGATTTRTVSTTTAPTSTVVHDDVSTKQGIVTTTVSRRTTLDVAVSWKSSKSPGVTGYTVLAILADGSTVDMGTVTGLTMAGSVDARYLAYGVRLSVRALTGYGWTADSAPTRLLTCA